MSAVLAILPEGCRYTTLWKAKVVFLPLTAINLYWAVHVSAQKIT